MAHSILSTMPPMTDELAEVEGEGQDAVDDREYQGENGDVNSKFLAEPKENMEDSCTTLDITADSTVTKLIPLSMEESSTSRPSQPLSRQDPLTPIKLTSLLAQSDELYALYPPSHPDLSLSSIMRPQSVVYTWSETFSALPTDVEAEAMVLRPELIVYPYMDDDILEESGGDSEEREEKPIHLKSKRRHFRGKLRGKLKGKRRGRVDHATGMVAGAVIVLGIAFAVYGVKMRDKHPGVGLGFLESQGRNWKKVATWAGGVVTGVERVVRRFSTSNGQ